MLHVGDVALPITTSVILCNSSLWLCLLYFFFFFPKRKTSHPYALSTEDCLGVMAALTILEIENHHNFSVLITVISPTGHTSNYGCLVLVIFLQLPCKIGVPSWPGGGVGGARITGGAGWWWRAGPLHPTTRTQLVI